MKIMCGVNNMEYNKISDVELQIMVDEARRVMPYQTQVLAVNAKMLAARLNALIDEGFTREEAVEIIKARGTE